LPPSSFETVTGFGALPRESGAFAIWRILNRTDVNRRGNDRAIDQSLQAR
jgi:hypothetical protein